MIYLFILFSVAAVGIASLWVQQKRERAHLESSEKFLSSLQKISPEVLGTISQMARGDSSFPARSCIDEAPIAPLG